MALESNLSCKFCGGKTIRRGNARNRYTSYSRLVCKSCGRWQSTFSRHKRSARILLLDIETLYMEVKGIWDLKTEYIQPDRIVKDWSILCYAAKWLFEPEIMGAVVSATEAINRTEKSILDGVWKLLDEADIVVTQNGNKFDIKRLNTKFIKYGFPPPSQYSSVDTLKVAQENFSFSSNKLDELAKNLLGLEGKAKMTIEDWDKCADGDKESLDKMIEYCRRDVAPLLEDLYLTLLPWIKGHPNLNLYTNHDQDVCPKCESSDLKWGSQYITPQGMWEGFRCNSCGSIGRGKGELHRVKSVSVV